MAPVVQSLKSSRYFEVKLVTTGQHIELVQSINEIFGIISDYPENIFEPGQSINEILTKSISCISRVIAKYEPDLVMVQGDTTTAMAGAIAAFLIGKKVVHIEAGLRTGNISTPFPEEFNRRVISLCTSIHFTATSKGKENLLSEGYHEKDIFTTGNTVIDSAKFIESILVDHSPTLAVQDFYLDNKEFILFTMHRRESWGEPMKDIFQAISKVAEENQDLNILFPVHPNPLVSNAAVEILGNLKNITLVPALDYVDMIQAISMCKFIITDSGGIQEEAPYFNKPVLVVRNETERSEGIASGCSQLIGTDGHSIYEATIRLINDCNLYESMATSINPYGDGLASERIRMVLEWYFSYSDSRPGDFIMDNNG
jgi:UDP-N-acetylglucosamine 2-epimerase (non-hydrolysing)